MHVPRKIYISSRFDHPGHALLVEELYNRGHHVYDFTNPAPGKYGFRWEQLGHLYPFASTSDFIKAITKSSIAEAAFARNKAALNWCDTCILLLPCGRSAHLEAGYAVGQGKQVFAVLSDDAYTPELMYLFTDGMVTTITDLLQVLAKSRPRFDIPSQSEDPKICLK